MNRSIALALMGLLTIAPVMTIGTAIGVQAQMVDARKIEADRLLKQGAEKFNANQFQDAVQFWNAALTLYRTLGEVRGER